jgi:hypothetical protein
MEDKKIDKTSVAGIFLSAVAVISIIALLLKNVFPTFSPINFLTRFIDSFGNVGQQTSNLLWGQRYMDLIAEAFLVLAAAACCVAMLKPDKNVEEKK